MKIKIGDMFRYSDSDSCSGIALVKEIEDRKVHVIWLVSKLNGEDADFYSNVFWDRDMLRNCQYSSVWSRLS